MRGSLNKIVQLEEEVHMAEDIARKLEEEKLMLEEKAEKATHEAGNRKGSTESSDD
jgi:hypothetical protein